MALLLTLIAVVVVGLLMLVNSAWARCKVAGHNWSRPWTDDGRRVHRCERCFKLVDFVYVPPVVPPGAYDQVSIDGERGVLVVKVGPTPVPAPIVTTLEELEELEAEDARAIERARVSAIVRAKWGRGTDSAGVN